MSSSCHPFSDKATKTKPTTTKRRKVAKACLFCKRSHMTCDDSRPCTRCLKREIGHLCCDEPPSAAERSNLLSTLNNLTQTSNHTGQQQDDVHLHLQTNSPQLTKPTDPITTRPLIDPTPTSCDTYAMDSFNRPINSLSHLTSLLSPRLLLSPSSCDSPLNHAFDQSLTFFRASNGLQLFEEIGTTHDASDHLENALFESSKMTPELRSEESLIDLNEFLHTYPGLFSDHSSNDNNLHLISSNGILDQSTISPAAIHHDQVLSNSNDPLFSHRSFLNPHDPLNPQSAEHKEDRLEQIIRSSGIEAFDYTRSEREITHWIESKLREPSKGKMLALWQESQNMFLTAAHQHNPEDSIELEYQFKRNLITCSPILDTLPIPGCIWRRTGEIYKTNEQFNSLIGIHSFARSSILSLLNHKKNSNFIKIHQLWDTDSFLNFSEKFNRIALDEGQKAVLTSCVLYRFKEKENVQTRKEIEKQLPASTSSSLSSLSSPHSDRKKVGETQPLKQDDTQQSEDQIQEQENTTRGLMGSTDDKSTFELNDSGKLMEVCDRINCTFSFTVRRDSFGLPCLIIGNFLPS